MKTLTNICVFAAASRRCDPVYFDAARRLGGEVARGGLTLYTGGGSTGLMGAVADAALGAGGRVVGILPRFMDAAEVGHKSLSEMVLVETMVERLSRMLACSEAYAALPGGCGTLEEILFVLTRKRVGQCTAPLVLVNTRGYFDPLVAMLERTVEERFMDPRHGQMWTVVREPEEVLPVLRAMPAWHSDAVRFAVP